jgi:hypothetical protein
MIFEGSILLPGGWELFVVNESEETTIIATGGRSAVARPSRHGCPAGHGWDPCGASLSAVRWLTTVRAPIRQNNASQSAPDDQRW